MPLISVHKRFKALIEGQLDRLFGTRLRLVADPGASRSVHEAVRAGAHERILIAVGPEGGWNAFEIDLLEAHGFQSVGMGSCAPLLRYAGWRTVLETDSSS